MIKSAGIVISAAAAGAVVSLGTAAAVAGTSSSAAIPPGTIHGCIALNSSRVLEHVFTSPASGRTCPRGQARAVWSIRGPAGARGASGTAGAKGATGARGSQGPPGGAGPGTAGPGGLDLITVTYVLAPGNTVAYATCPQGHPYLLGGGGDDGGGNPLSASIGTPAGVVNGAIVPGVWKVVRSTVNGGTGLTVQAICAK